MAEYKCIGCGEIRESGAACSCPMCGYKMFETPYDRGTVLASEIAGFISRLEITAVAREDLIFEGKEEDDSRFPDYDKILKYVSGRERTEEFFKRLLEMTQQLKRHFTETFSNTYPVSFVSVDRLLKQYDEELLLAAAVLSPDVHPVLNAPQWEAASLLYAEIPNKYLWASASELIDLIEKLAKKLVHFIKANNLYGNIHKFTPKRRCDEYTEGTDFKDALEDAISRTLSILDKKYVVDIAGDGSDEVKEMLTCLWNGVELIMCAPLFLKSYDYFTEGGHVSEKEFLKQLSARLEERYADYNQAIRIDALLRENTEDTLFGIYRGLISIDKSGILVPAGTTLIHIGESERRLDELIGLSGIKDSIRKIKAYALANQGGDALNIHMCFLGNPGTGKTEVARYIAGILYENRILPTNKVVEVDRSGLVSQYFGATAEKTSQAISRAMGGVLFVDEAYALGNHSEYGTDYGKEAIDTLVKAMEDHRGKFCVILAGYKNEMLQMLSTNPGFKSRIQFVLDFPNYSRDELKQIAKRMLQSRHYSMGEAAMDRILDITDIKRREPNFANAREIRNILDQVIMCQNLRCAGTEDDELGMVDVNQYIQDAKLQLPLSCDRERKIQTGEEELEQLVGLTAVKRMVKKIRAYAKRNRGQEDFNLHMCFYGNPGTGKTEVARILSRILYDAGVLPEAKLVETDPHDLLGKFVGETGQKNQAKINDAMNGVLFIDEAYGLTPSHTAGGGAGGCGEEALSVLLKAMEDHRGQFCVIFAGYEDEIKTMLGANPGLASRIQFTINFLDYTRGELGEIAASFLRRKNYRIAEPALDRLLDVTEYYRSRPNFANARTIRNVLDQVIMNQNLRTEDTEGDDLIVMEDVEDYLTDEGIELTKAGNGQRRIGFMA